MTGESGALFGFALVVARVREGGLDVESERVDWAEYMEVVEGVSVGR